MAGAILSAYGKQRSGKTLFMYLLVQEIKRQYGNIPVYSNIPCPGWHFINSLSEIPFNFKPKVLFIDEAYNGADAQQWKELSEISIFINTVGKQNILFLITTIDMEMIYNRIRKQINAGFLVKSDQQNIYYRMINNNNNYIKDFTIKKTPELFKDIKYDTTYIPIDFNWDIKEFKEKLLYYYKRNYPQLLKYVKN